MIISIKCKLNYEDHRLAVMVAVSDDYIKNNHKNSRHSKYRINTVKRGISYKRRIIIGLIICDCTIVISAVSGDS